MRLLGRLSEILRQRRGRHTLRPESLRNPPMDAPPRFGEFLAASMLPDCGGVPLEYWSGYRRLSAGDDEARVAATSKLFRHSR